MKTSYLCKYCELPITGSLLHNQELDLDGLIALATELRDNGVEQVIPMDPCLYRKKEEKS